MAEGAAVRALRASLSVLGEAERDQAAIHLARRYAALLDGSAVPSAYRAALARLDALAVSKADRAAFDKIADAISAHSVASDLGPKYLAVLQQLGLTPAARGAKAAAPQPEPVPEPEGKADELRKRREQRRALAADPR